MTRPLVIVLEGPDGVGKTTHARLLADALRGRGRLVRLFHHPRPPKGAGFVEAALFYAAERAGLLRRTEADVIVADRWHTSTRVLGTALHGVDFRTRVALDQLSRVEEEYFARGPHATREITLDAGDEYLDARLEARGTPTTSLDRAIRAQYRRRADLVDASGPTLATAQRIFHIADCAVLEVQP